MKKFIKKYRSELELGRDLGLLLASLPLIEYGRNNKHHWCIVLGLTLLIVLIYIVSGYLMDFIRDARNRL